MIDHDLNCASHGPDGAMCQKIRGHKGTDTERRNAAATSARNNVTTRCRHPDGHAGGVSPPVGRIHSPSPSGNCGAPPAKPPSRNAAKPTRSAGDWPHWKDESMSERASQTAQRYVDAMNIASAKIEQLQAEVEALRGQNAALIGMVDRDTAAIQRVLDVADAWEHYALEGGKVRTAWAAKLIRNALDGDA